MTDFASSRFKRIPEPELMLEENQALAYARANFDDAHSTYPRLFHERFPEAPSKAQVLDLGCGPCDVTRRFATLYRGWTFDAVDGSPAMLEQAKTTLKRHRLQHRVNLVQALLPAVKLPHKRYDVILASSLLHHLHDPAALWTTVRRRIRSGTIVFVPDLRRPATRRDARRLVDRYAANEPDVLRRDFHNSLLAAFTPQEVALQLTRSSLSKLAVEPLGDRHLLVLGRL